MDDLISRQAAIDEIKGFQHRAAEWRDEQEERSDIWHRADSAIASALEIGLRVKKLPSAQPDIARSIATIIENEKDMRVILTSVNQWIPCSERLPKAGEYIGDVARYYLVQNEYGDMLVARYTHSEYWEQIYQSKPYADEIVAWMPLPKPYKGEES